MGRAGVLKLLRANVRQVGTWRPTKIATVRQCATRARQYDSHTRRNKKVQSMQNTASRIKGDGPRSQGHTSRHNNWQRKFHNTPTAHD